jgi:pimeloyl-ACP methyl ester carboxylesterase
VGPDRVRAWIDGVQKLEGRADPNPMSPEEALRRLAVNHPTISPEVLGTRVRHLVRVEGAGVVWCFDPLHRTRSPAPFFAKLSAEFAKRVTSPALFVSGGRGGYHPADEEERLAAFEKLERVTLEGAGHMLHWTKPAELVKVLLAFLDR